MKTQPFIIPILRMSGLREPNEGSWATPMGDEGTNLPG